MKETVKERWVKALRSGNYRQTNAVLANGEGGFCCLGVLCEIAVGDEVIESRSVPSERVIEYFNPGNADQERSVLPETVYDWAGLSGQNPVVRFNINDIPEPYRSDITANWSVEEDGSSAATLAGLNDSGLPFDVIANIIEKDL